MSFYSNPFEDATEPSQSNIRHWMDSLYSKFMPIEQARWNQANIDTLFHAGCQTFVNRYFNFAPTSSYQQYYFNLIQQPINLVSGYQRQHRKSINYVPTEGGDPDTTDQYTRIITHVSNSGGLHEQFSKACELSAISGMVLMQPYLDFMGKDQAQGDMNVKIWEYNSFLIDPFFRNPDMSDCQFVWCQEYISKQEAMLRFQDKQTQIASMSGTPQRYGNFYFLPENYNMARNDLLVLSYIWYKTKKMKKRLYSRSRNQFFDFAGGEDNLEEILYNIQDMEEVTVEVPCWKVALVLNDILMFQGENPLGIEQCPFVMIPWNYDPHISFYDLRVRSLVRPMRDPQFLFNYKVITNNDIAAATINAGWKRKVGAVANEDNLKKTGQGYDVLINEGYEMTDVDKILPSVVPESDLALAQQMADLTYKVTGIDMENWAGQDDAQISTLTALIKQAANLMVFQKYFDQWDHCMKLLGEIYLSIVQNNWNAQKVALLIGEEPTAFFYSKIFSSCQVIVEEGLLTPTQKNFQARQMLEINQVFGREVLPPSMIIADMNIQGKAKIMQFLQQQEQSMQESQEQEMLLKHAFEDAKLKELYSRATANIASAKERYGRFESNIGLLEERISEISKNRSLSTKAKMEALEKMMEVIGKYGEIETSLKAAEIQSFDWSQKQIEDEEKNQAYKEANSNEFMSKIMSGMGNPQQNVANQNFNSIMGQNQQEPQMAQMG